MGEDGRSNFGKMKTKLPPADLIEEMLLKNGEVATKIYGSSMSPLLSGGKKVLVKAADSREIRLGDVVCFRSDLQLVAHRVVRIRRSRKGVHFLTKADNGPTFDRYVASDKVLGKVTTVEGHPLTTILWKILNRAISTISFLEGRASDACIKIPLSRLSWWSRKAFNRVLLRTQVVSTEGPLRR